MESWSESSKDWIAKEFKEWGKLKYDPESFALAEDHHLIQLQMEECEGILSGGLWFIVSQLLVVEPWVADFIPNINMVHRMVIWVGLLGLAMDY